MKPKDGDPLLRHDLQWDALQLIFDGRSCSIHRAVLILIIVRRTDTHFQFTPPTYPNPESPLFPTDRTWTFAELYLDCLANSSKATRTQRDKMAEEGTTTYWHERKRALRWVAISEERALEIALAVYDALPPQARTWQ